MEGGIKLNRHILTRIYSLFLLPNSIFGTISYRSSGEEIVPVTADAAATAGPERYTSLFG